MKATTTDPQRSAVMRAVRSKDTTTELIVRRLIHSMGFRYRLHQKELPGTPDLVFPGRRKVVFVHGCFWHGHECSRGARKPKSNADYWQAKIARNIKRDERNNEALREAEWDVMTVWECDTKVSAREDLSARLMAFLGSESRR
ncbi:very short patch repair endonuclease [Rhizobium sp. R635]|uniref:very short patch repair endonuclease n=1 Tax=Rhizobium sp. R635 TaxID=1764275 RepID=UPI000B532238|nr:very short patch repair endonuclease [Rhizobium sp. R635]OWV92210.1 very short patch repair endonuclease [Rhizobium sp. R635]